MACKYFKDHIVIYPPTYVLKTHYATRIENLIRLLRVFLSLNDILKDLCDTI